MRSRAPSEAGLGVGGATVVLAPGHVAVAAEDGALGDHDLRRADVADEACRSPGSRRASGPRSRPAARRSRPPTAAETVALTLPPWPTRSSRPMRIWPSTVPSITTSSSPRISPLMVVFAPSTQSVGETVRTGAGGRRRRPERAAGTPRRWLRRRHRPRLRLRCGRRGRLRRLVVRACRRFPWFLLLELVDVATFRSFRDCPGEDLERATGFEPATPSLGSSYSTN